MTTVNDVIVEVFTLYASQLFLILGGLVGVAKWLDRRQNKKIKSEVENQLNGLAKSIFEQLATFKETLQAQQHVNEMAAEALKANQEVTKKSLEFLDKQLEHLNRMEEARVSKASKSDAIQ